MDINKRDVDILELVRIGSHTANLEFKALIILQSDRSAVMDSRSFNFLAVFGARISGVLPQQPVFLFRKPALGRFMQAAHHLNLAVASVKALRPSLDSHGSASFWFANEQYEIEKGTKITSEASP